MKPLKKYLITILSTLLIQSLILIVFRHHLTTAMPTYFSITGVPTNYYHYDRPILGPALLFLAAITLANLAVRLWLRQLANSGILNAKLIANFAKILIVWLWGFTWVLLFYFFNLSAIGQVFMVVLNIGAFVTMLTLVRQFYHDRFKR